MSGNIRQLHLDEFEMRIHPSKTSGAPTKTTETIGKCRIQECGGDIVVESHFKNVNTQMGGKPVMEETGRECFCVACGVGYKESMVRKNGS